jgi:4-hydroxy-tetrahydrodipicolinate reductase
MSELKIGIVGCAGRMGQILVKQVTATDGCVVTAGTEASNSGMIGKDIGTLAGIGNIDIAVSDDADAMFQAVDAVIDFTIPAVSLANTKLAARYGKIHVVGTTGMTNEEQAEVAAAGSTGVIIQSANMSLGVNILSEITKQVAAALNDDAPSGTALLLGKAAAEGRGVDHDSVADRGRDGMTGPRKRGDIGYAVLRGGMVVGDHSVIFQADDERIEITHKAGDRSIFARGAVTAALWGSGKAPGKYDMIDVLGLK